MIDTDILLERIKLKSSLRFWRLLAIVGITFLVVVLIGNKLDYKIPGKSYIARLTVQDMILTDRERAQAIEKIANDNSVKAVIVNIDSQGGTATGGEALYYSLRDLQQKKPVVVVMENMATSAGYLIATPADRIFAHKATLTGSIGVVLQIPNVTELAKKIGVSMQVIKTGELKAAPSLFEPMTPNVEKVLQALADDFYKVFIEIIVEHRDLSTDKVMSLADGRVFSGLQAVKNGLIDEIGTEKNALLWLEENKDISKNLPIFDVEYGEEENPIKELLKSYSGKSLLPKELSTHGLLAMWNNSVIR